jgi:hypothetical protein
MANIGAECDELVSQRSDSIHKAAERMDLAVCCRNSNGPPLDAAVDLKLPNKTSLLQARSDSVDGAELPGEFPDSSEKAELNLGGHLLRQRVVLAHGISFCAIARWTCRRWAPQPKDRRAIAIA